MIQRPVVYKKQLIGQIFVKRGLINKDQLKEALELQKMKGKFLGELLIELRYLSDKDLVMGLSSQCSIPYLPATRYRVKKEIASIIPKELALSGHVICIDKFKDVITVIMANPLDEKLIDDLIKLSNCSLGICIATIKEIDEAINRTY